MGKHEVGTPKYIANKIKAKGLQKLRWYCQMCQKQCRDENGFKCHTSSESHQRQLLIVADNPDKFVDEFSKEFEAGYLELLRRQFGTKRVPANKVYQDYIADRNHLHMNATQWETLTEFVKWLGREGKCVVDETEKGWFVTYIDRDPETIRLQEKIAKKEKMEKDDDERNQDFLNKQIEKGKEKNSKNVVEPTELKKGENEVLKLQLAKPIKPVLLAPTLDSALPVNEKREKKPSEKRKKELTALEQIIKEEEEKVAKKFKHGTKNDYWLMEGIVVKVVADSLGEKFCGKKGVVTEVINKYVGVVKLFDTGHKLKLDQEHLQTVIPNIGKKVKILNGVALGSVAELLKVDISKYSVSIKILDGQFKGRVVGDIPYEDISKINE